MSSRPSTIVLYRKKWYSASDVLCLLRVMRKRLKFIGDKSEYEPWNENMNRTILLNPCSVAYVSSFLTEAAQKVSVGLSSSLTAWNMKPLKIIIPFITHSHWRTVCLFFSEKINQAILYWDDPFGPNC
jgi:hypothetical protein